jgi:hypothetical protein
LIVSNYFQIHPLLSKMIFNRVNPLAAIVSVYIAAMYRVLVTLDIPVVKA